jgi:hypothetical protein
MIYLSQRRQDAKAQSILCVFAPLPEIYVALGKSEPKRGSPESSQPKLVLVDKACVDGFSGAPI